MPDEIDRLEIAVEAEANNANRALGTMEKKLNRVADSLEKVMIMAQGGFSFKNVDFDKLLSGSAMKNSAKRSGKELSDSLISGFNLDKAGADVQKQVKALTSKISKGLAETSGHPYKGLDKDMKSLGALVSKNGSIAKSTSDDYQRLYETIKAMGRIKIHPATAKSLGDSYKDRSGVLKQKINTSSGTELDSIYQELKGQFPGILKDVNNVEDEFYQLNDAIKKFYETSKGTYKPDWLEDSAYESVADGVSDIVSGIQKAKTESTDLSASMHDIEDTGKSFSELFGAGLDTSGLEKAASLSREITRQRSDSQKKNRTDLKFPALPYSEINEKFANSKLTTDFSSMGISDLRNEVSKNQRAYDRMKQSIADKVALSGTDEMGGKDWYRSIMQMKQYENAVNDIIATLDKLNSRKETSSFGVERGETPIVSDIQNPIKNISSDAMNYDAGAMKAVFGDEAENIKNFNDLMTQTGKNGFEAAQAINEFNSELQKPVIGTYEDRIKGLKAELSELSNQGFGQYDPQYDAIAKELADVTYAKKQYDATMRDSAKADFGKVEAEEAGDALERATKKANFFSRALDRIKNSAKSVNSAEKSFNNISKSIQNAKNMANKAMHPLRTLRELISGTSNQASKGMSWGKMLGSSLMFSTVFGAISQIKEAIKAGSDNLVQYSSAYNKSISGMVTSLLYLKNAWAAAFAPIINVVAPYISKFIDMIAGALNAVGQFTAALTGKGHVVQAKKAWYDYGKSLESTGKSASNTSKKLKDAKKAAKDLENYTLGIDELHVIQPNKDDSSSTDPNSGSGKYTGPSPSEMFETIEVPNSMNKLSDMFKEAIKNSDFTDIGRMISDKLANALEGIKWNNIYQHADNFGKDLATFLNGLITPRLFYDLGATIAGAINTALHAANSFAINFDWSNFGSSIASSIQGFFENWDAGLTGETFSNFFSGIFDAMTGFLNTLDETNTFETIGQKIVDLLCGVKWGKMGWSLFGFFKALSKALVDFPSDFAKGVAKGILKHIFGDKFDEEAQKKVEKAFKAIKKFTGTQMENLFPPLGIFNQFATMFDIGTKIKNGIGDIDVWFNEKFGSSREAVERNFDDIGPWFGGQETNVEDSFKDIDVSLGTKFKNARDTINEKFQDVGTWFAGKKKEVQDSQNGIEASLGNKYKSARTYVNNAFSDVGKWFGDKKTAVQNAQDSISAWFDNKYKEARSNANSSFENIGKWFGNKKLDIQSNMSSISDWFSQTFKKAYDGVTSVWDGIKSYFEKVAKFIEDPVKGALNGVREAVNWIYGKLGGSGELIPKFATGTSGVARDTFGVVNDQAGSTYRELVQFPNGKTIIPTGRNVVLPMPKGTKVLPANETSSLVQMKKMPHFKKGIGDFFSGAWARFTEFTGDVASYISNPKKLVQMAIDNFTDFQNYLEPGLSIAKGAVSTMVDTATKFIKGKFDELGVSSSVNYTPSAGVEQWRALAKQALEMTGQFTESNLNRLLMQMRTESGGNPRAINNWDINAKNGVPSKGLMQVIDPTFRAYAQAPYNKDIYDPMSNILAAIRYTLSRYGSLERGWKGHGYADGGFPKVGEMFYANESGPELVGKIGNRTAVVNKTQIVESVSSGVERANDETNALLRTVIEYQKLLLKKETNVNIDGKRADKRISKARRNTGFSFSPT